MSQINEWDNRSEVDFIRNGITLEARALDLDPKTVIQSYIDALPKRAVWWEGVNLNLLRREANKALAFTGRKPARSRAKNPLR